MVTVVYTIFARKPAFFQNPFAKLKKRSDSESHKSGFRFDLKNLLGVWILWIHDLFLDFTKKPQNPFLDSETLIRIFPKKRTQERQAEITQ